MYIVIFITTSGKKEAKDIATQLVRNKLVACVNIVERMESLFRWKGKVERSRESLLIAKSKKDKLNKIIKLVKCLHSYKVPEIIALPIAGGYKPYLNWIDDSVN